ncbi:hypothetical protein, partial [Rhizobium sophoriradicis]|uniref:hypothetical protein n=1 Tax=Rhizobium sophoriradicis TaxID=1535245 RepID=UPI001ABFEC2D
AAACLRQQRINKAELTRLLHRHPNHLRSKTTESYSQHFATVPAGEKRICRPRLVPRDIC